jgi:ABC-type transporter Mla subunit MlaD
MSERARQLKIGAFVLVGVAVAVAGVLSLGVRSKLERTATLETYVTGNVGGLVVGSPVKLKGVRVGEVTAMGFSWREYPGGEPSCVVVHFKVKEDLRPADLDAAVKRGLRAIIEAEGITGVSHLSLDEVDPEKNPPVHHSWMPRSPVIPSAPSAFTQMLSSAATTLGQLQQLDVERLVSATERILQTADRALERLAELDVKGVSHRLNRTLDSTSAAALEFRALASDSRRSVDALHLDALGQHADHLLASAEETNAKLERLLDRLSAVDVRGVNETLASARRAADHLDESVEEMRRYPPGFLFGEAPPRIGGLEEEKR